MIMKQMEEMARNMLKFSIFAVLLGIVGLEYANGFGIESMNWWLLESSGDFAILTNMLFFGGIYYAAKGLFNIIEISWIGLKSII